MSLVSLSTHLYAKDANKTLFDTHIHYNANDAAHINPAKFLQIMDRNHIKRAVVIGTPSAYMTSLYRAAPDRILPFLSVYLTPEDKQDWHQKKTIPQWLSKQLDKGPWVGIGELHLFAAHRASPVFKAIVKLASERKLILHMHADPAVIDTLYEHNPNARVIWAHAGAYPYPPLLRDYLTRYPKLMVDLSVREELIAPNGKLDGEWEALFLDYSDRFMVGVDTYSAQRWARFDREIQQINGWLKQLPEAVAQGLAYRNAERLFDATRSKYK